MNHQFKRFFYPDPAAFGELDIIVHECSLCGLSIENPQDMYPLSEIDAAVEFGTDDWFVMSSLPVNCEEHITGTVHES